MDIHAYKNGLTFKICLNFIPTVEVFIMKLKVCVAVLKLATILTASTAFKGYVETCQKPGLPKVGLKN